MAVSSAYITAAVGGRKQTWHFTGVTSIEHNLSLNLNSTASRESDMVSGARNRPDRVTLSVIETDAVRGAGGSARILADMDALKRSRTLCRVVTSMGTYRKMLLSEITAAQDEENQCGWKGTLSFTEYEPSAGKNTAGAKVNNNASARKNTGTTAVKKLTESAFLRLLQRAGIR